MAYPPHSHSQLRDYWDTSDLSPTIHEAALQRAFTAGLEAIHGTPDTGWLHHSAQQGVDIATKTVAGSPLQSCRGVGVIHCEAPVIVSVFGDIEHRHRWDAMVANGTVVEQVNRLTRVAYSAFKAPWPVSKREMLVIGRVRRMDDGSLYSYATSVSHPQYHTAAPGHVRADLVFYALLVTPLTPSRDGRARCRVSYAACSNPRGSLPRVLVNAAQVAQPLCIASVNKLLLGEPRLVREVKSKLLALYQQHGCDPIVSNGYKHDTNTGSDTDAAMLTFTVSSPSPSRRHRKIVTVDPIAALHSLANATPPVNSASPLQQHAHDPGVEATSHFRRDSDATPTHRRNGRQQHQPMTPQIASINTSDSYRQSHSHCHLIEHSSEIDSFADRAFTASPHYAVTHGQSISEDDELIIAMITDEHSKLSAFKLFVFTLLSFLPIVGSVSSTISRVQSGVLLLQILCVEWFVLPPFNDPPRTLTISVRRTDSDSDNDSVSHSVSVDSEGRLKQVLQIALPIYSPQLPIVIDVWDSTTHSRVAHTVVPLKSFELSSISPVQSQSQVRWMPCQLSDSLVIEPRAVRRLCVNSFLFQPSKFLTVAAHFNGGHRAALQPSTADHTVDTNVDNLSNDALIERIAVVSESYRSLLPLIALIHSARTGRPALAAITFVLIAAIVLVLPSLALVVISLAFALALSIGQAWQLKQSAAIGSDRWIERKERSQAQVKKESDTMQQSLQRVTEWKQSLLPMQRTLTVLASFLSLLQWRSAERSRRARLFAALLAVTGLVLPSQLALPLVALGLVYYSSDTIQCPLWLCLRVVETVGVDI